MPPRSKSGPGQCSKCDRIYTNLLEHITKQHQHDRFEQEEVEEYGLVACVCGRVVQNRNGLAKHHSRYGCLSIPNTAPRVSILQSAVTSTLTSLSASTPQPTIPACPPSISMSSTLTPLSSTISRITVRPVDLHNNPLMPSSIRRIPPVALTSTMPFIVDGDEEEEEELEDNPFQGQDVDIGGGDAFGEEGMDEDEVGDSIREDNVDAEGEEDFWSEEGGGQDIEMLDNSWQEPQVGGALLSSSPGYQPSTIDTVHSSSINSPLPRQPTLSRNHIDHHLNSSKSRRHSNNFNYTRSHINPYQPDNAPNYFTPTYSTFG